MNLRFSGFYSTYFKSENWGLSGQMKIWQLTFLDSAYLKYESKLKLPLLPKKCTHICFLGLFLRISSWLESSTRSGSSNVGREWCCRGWSIEGGTPGRLFRARDGLPRIRKARAASKVHECESVCAWKKTQKTKKHCICAEMAALYECLYVCCISLYMYM